MAIFVIRDTDGAQTEIEAGEIRMGGGNVVTLVKNGVNGTIIAAITLAPGVLVYQKDASKT